MVRFIGIGHKKRVGKNTFADILLPKLEGKATVIAFADPLKNLAMEALGLTYHQAFGDEKETLSKVLDSASGFPLTAREVLQRLGITIRNAWPGLWTNAPFLRTYDPKIKYVIIPDLRFQDEAEEIAKRKGLLIKINRATAPVDHHESETALNSFDRWDYVIWNNNTFRHLDEEAERIAKDILNDGL